jgi:hypothetical protein
MCLAMPACSSASAVLCCRHIQVWSALRVLAFGVVVDWCLPCGCIAADVDIVVWQAAALATPQHPHQHSLLQDPHRV